MLRTGIFVTIVAGMMAILVLQSGSVAPLRGSAVAATDLGLRFTSNNTWYVCQGYQTTISHRVGTADEFGLDLIYGTKPGAGTGCPSDGDTAGKAVYSPIAGRVAWTSPSLGGTTSGNGLGLVCIKINSSRSVKVGHLRTSDWLKGIKNGTSYSAWNSVSGSSLLGYVATANSYNAVPHVHVGVFKDASCQSPIPFETASGTALHGRTDHYCSSGGAWSQTNTWNLYNKSGGNDWRLTAMWRVRTLRDC